MRAFDPSASHCALANNAMPLADIGTTKGWPSDHGDGARGGAMSTLMAGACEHLVWADMRDRAEPAGGTSARPARPFRHRSWDARLGRLTLVFAPGLRYP